MEGRRQERKGEIEGGRKEPDVGSHWAVRVFKSTSGLDRSRLLALLCIPKQFNTCEGELVKFLPVLGQ